MLQRTLLNHIKVSIRYHLPRAIADGYYWLSGNNRKLPDFLIIGAQKSGTTSLFHYLSQHPKITVSRRKEVHFFSKHYHNGLRYYRSFFPKNTSSQLSGEASPYYLFHPLAPKRIKETIPKAKIIILLRNPVERAYSHYQMMKGLDSANSFKEAINLEKERVTLEEVKFNNQPSYTSESHQAFSYLSRGLYHRQLKRWLEHYKLEELIIIKSEEFYSNPKGTLKKIYSSLHIDEVYPSQISPQNIRKYPPLAKDEYDYLVSYFSEDQQLLKQLLGNTFTWT